MRLKVIACQVFTREFEYIPARSARVVDLELIPMGSHSRDPRDGPIKIKRATIFRSLRWQDRFYLQVSHR